MRFAVAFARFWWDFVVGDEWRFAAIVCVVAVLGGLASAGGWTRGSVIAVAVAGGLMLAVCGIILATGRARHAHSARRS